MDVKSTYPARYYASLDKPCAWYDTWVMSKPEVIPPVSELYAMTEAEWQAKGGDYGSKSMAVIDGKLVPYVQTVSVQHQAENELSWINQQAALASAMGETFTDEMKAYVKAIQAIATGADTSSTELPQRPAEGKVAAS